MKRCSECQKKKPASDFHKDRSRPDGLQSRCKPCNTIVSRRYRQQHADVINARRRQNYAEMSAEDKADAKRQTLYGLSRRKFDKLAVQQEHKCAICRKAGKLCVDHDHGSGAVRGLLCSRCNAGIGLLGDDAGRLLTAARYVASDKFDELILGKHGDA